MQLRVGVNGRRFNYRLRKRKDRLLILSDIGGRGDHSVAVPFDILNRTGKSAFALNIMGDDLASAPSFHASDLYARGYFGELQILWASTPPTEG